MACPWTRLHAIQQAQVQGTGHMTVSQHFITGADNSILELLGANAFLHHGRLRHPVCYHWPVPLPPLFLHHHAQLLLAAGLLPHLLQLLPQHHLLQVKGRWHSDGRSVCSGNGSRVSGHPHMPITSCSLQVQGESLHIFTKCSLQAKGTFFT